MPVPFFFLFLRTFFAIHIVNQEDSGPMFVALRGVAFFQQKELCAVKAFISIHARFNAFIACHNLSSPDSVTRL